MNLYLCSLCTDFGIEIVENRIKYGGSTKETLDLRTQRYVAEKLTITVVPRTEHSIRMRTPDSQLWKHSNPETPPKN